MANGILRANLSCTDARRGRGLRIMPVGRRIGGLMRGALLLLGMIPRP
jgi:hypothetical protein